MKIKIVTNSLKKEENASIYLRLNNLNTTVYTLPIPPYRNQTIVIPCEILQTQSRYFVQVIRNDTKSMIILEEEILDVRWPTMKLTASPSHTYTFANKSIVIILERTVTDNLQCFKSGKIMISEVKKLLRNNMKIIVNDFFYKPQQDRVVNQCFLCVRLHCTLTLILLESDCQNRQKTASQIHNFTNMSQLN